MYERGVVVCLPQWASGSTLPRCLTAKVLEERKADWAMVGLCS